MFRGFTAVLMLCAVLGSVSSEDAAAKGKYLVKASGGPGPGSPAEAVALLEGMVIPTFEMIMKWEKAGKAVAGLPAGDRAIVMIVTAESNAEVDNMLRMLPAWPVLDWKVIPLQSIVGRSDMEKKVVKELKAMN